ncbi:Adenine deaminase [Raoultella ornithinolytica]|nr:Adenine deaminase [Raoultella ornithinolytica]
MSRRICCWKKAALSALLNLLIEHGLAATDVLRFATLNAAIRLQRHDSGLIAAGRRADLVVFDSLERLEARESVRRRENWSPATGALLQPIPAAEGVTPPAQYAAAGAAEYRGFCAAGPRYCPRRCPPATYPRRALYAVGRSRGAGYATAKFSCPLGFSLIWVKHRHGRHQATPQIALLEGWGELRGAIATSYSHDSHNLVVLGRNAEDMALAANRLIASGGGMALSRQGDILAHVAMPIAGMLSDLPAAETRAAVPRITRPERRNRRLGAAPTGYLRPSKALASPAMPDHI